MGLVLVLVVVVDVVVVAVVVKIYVVLRSGERVLFRVRPHAVMRTVGVDGVGAGEGKCEQHWLSLRLVRHCAEAEAVLC